MKKKLSIILTAVIAVLFGFSVLGSSAKAASSSNEEIEQQYIAASTQIVEMIADEATNGNHNLEYYMKSDAVAETLSQWNTMMETLGGYNGTDTSKSTASVDSSTGDGTINVSVKGANGRTGTVTITLAGGNLSSISASAEDTFAESLEKAGMNTIVGLLMAFGVLSLSAVIIRLLFPQINKLSKKLDDKKNGTPSVSEAPKAAPAAPAAAPAAEETSSSDDEELVAVIAAAVAAYEGKAGTDGFVVRSIRRHI